MFLGALWHTELPGQGSDRSCSSNLSCSCENMGSLTHCAELGMERHPSTLKVPPILLCDSGSSKNVYFWNKVSLPTCFHWCVRASFCPPSRLMESPKVLDLASKSTKRDVSLGGCSLNKPPFLMLLKGSTKFNKAKTFNIHQVSVKTLLGFVSSQMILTREPCLTRGAGGGAGRQRGVWITRSHGGLGLMGHQPLDYTKKSRWFSFQLLFCILMNMGGLGSNRPTRTLTSVSQCL